MKKTIIPKEILENVFINNEKNISKTAKELNYSVKIIVSNLDYHNIERRRVKKTTNYLYRDKDWLYNEYCILNTPMDEIAIKCNTTTDVLYDWINKYKLPKRASVFYISYEELYSLYVVMKKSTVEIGKMYGVSDVTISDRLKKYTIPIRDASENQKIYTNEKCKDGELSERQKTIWKRSGYRDKMSNIHKQIHIDNPSLREHHSAKMQGLNINEWNGFINNENDKIRKSSEYSDWRLQVLNIYSYRCAKCGSGDNLNVHHIENFSSNKELRFDVNNGVVLCEYCHLQKHKNSFHSLYGVKNNTLNQLLEFLK